MGNNAFQDNLFYHVLDFYNLGNHIFSVKTDDSEFYLFNSNNIKTWDYRFTLKFSKIFKFIKYLKY